MGCQPDEPCTPWDLPTGCCREVCEDDDTELARFLAIATATVYRATCFRFPGACDIELQPCRPCRTDCRCRRCNGPSKAIPLDEAGLCYPILLDETGLPLVEVVVDGQTAGGWRLNHDRVTLEHFGSGSWPEQDLELDPGDPGTWTIRATIGRQPPADLLYGTARLACELLKECKGFRQLWAPTAVGG